MMYSSMPTMYNQSVHRKKVQLRRPLLTLVGLVAVLAMLRILNLGFCWHMNRLELQNKPVLSGIQYSFLGFSSEAKAKEELEKTGGFGKNTLTVISYYDLSTPIGSIIENRRETPGMVDLGRFIVYSCPGRSVTKLFPYGLLVQECSGKYYEKQYERFLLQRVLPARSGSLSFIEKPVSASPYLRWPHLLYFYAPLIMLLILTLRFGAGMLTGFIYFVEVFFLFDYYQALVDVPLFWVKNLTGGEFDAGGATMIAVGIAVFALLLCTAGLIQWKSLREYPSAKWWILFFFLLPFALRF